MATILWITNAPAPYRHLVWENLSEDFHLVVAFTGTPTGEHEWREHERAVYKATWDWRPGDVKRADVVIVGQWENFRALSALLRAKLLAVPVVVFYESTEKTHRFRRGPISWLRKLVFRAADGVVTVGSASTRAVRALGVPDDHITTSFNAVDVDWFNSRAQSRAQDNCTAVEGHTTIFVGQLIERKNVEVAMLAWNEQAGDADKLLIAGSGPLEDKLRTTARQLRMDQIHFLGYIEGEALADAYSKAHTLILPSTEEVWGLVVNEALAAGCHAVISSEVGASEDVADMSGVFVAAPRKNDLANALSASRACWRGRIAKPEILVKTPEALAQAIARRAVLSSVRSEVTG